MMKSLYIYLKAGKTTTCISSYVDFKKFEKINLFDEDESDLYIRDSKGYLIGTVSSKLIKENKLQIKKNEYSITYRLFIPFNIKE